MFLCTQYIWELRTRIKEGIYNQFWLLEASYKTFTVWTYMLVQIVPFTWNLSIHCRYRLASIWPDLKTAMSLTASCRSLARVTLISFSVRVSHSLILGLAAMDTGVANTTWMRNRKKVSYQSTLNINTFLKTYRYMYIICHFVFLRCPPLSFIIHNSW